MALTIGTLMAKAGLEIDSGSFRALETALTNAKTSLAGLSTESKLGLSAGLAAIPTAIAGIGAAGLSVASNFEDASATLTTLYGDVGIAKEKFQDLSTFAAQTPFEFPELLDATVKLKAYGIEASSYLGVLGDTSSAMGKQLNDSVEALADAQTGEFERLKEFGVKAVEITKKNADTLGASAEQIGLTALTYTDKYGKAQIKVIDRNNRDAITAALVGVDGIFQKYTGAMETRSKTMSGMLSTLKDNISMSLADLVGFNSNVDEFGISALSLAGALKGLVGAGISLTGWLSGASEPVQTMVVSMGLAVAAAAALAAGYIAYGAVLPMVTAAQTALGVSIWAAMAPVAAVLLGIGALAAGLYILEEKTGAVSYSWNLLKDLFTIVFDGISTAASMFYNGLVEFLSRIKQAIVSIIPESWITGVSNAVSGIVDQFSRMGINIHSQAEGIRTDNQNVVTSTQEVGTQATSTSGVVSGATGLMGQTFDTLGLSASNANAQVGAAGVGIQTTFSNVGVSAGNMGLQTAAAGTQSINALNGIGSTSTTVGAQVVAATGNMYAGFIQTKTGAEMASGGIIGVTPAINSLTGATNAGASANQSYAASFVDVSNMASEAASTAINAASRIGNAIKTSAAQVGNIEALAGKWNTRAALGTTSSGGSGTGESGVKIIAAKTTNNITVKA